MYRFKVTEISALLGRHCAGRPQKDEIINHIQYRHPKLAKYLPEGFQVLHKKAFVTEAIKKRIEGDSKMTHEKLVEIAKEVPVVSISDPSKKRAPVDLPEKPPALLKSLRDSPPKRKKRKSDMQLSAVRCHLGNNLEKLAIEKYCKQRGESIEEEQPWVDGHFHTAKSNIEYRILGRADFFDSSKNVGEVKNRAGQRWIVPVYDVDQCCLYSILTNRDARLVQQRPDLGKEWQVMIADLPREEMLERWLKEIKPGLDAFVESLHECYQSL